VIIRENDGDDVGNFDDNNNDNDDVHHVKNDDEKSEETVSHSVVDLKGK